MYIHIYNYAFIYINNYTCVYIIFEFTNFAPSYDATLYFVSHVLRPLYFAPLYFALQHHVYYFYHLCTYYLGKI